MKYLYCRFFCIVLAMLVFYLPGLAVNIDDITINTQSELTIISFVFDSETDIPFRKFTLADPERIYFDLSGTSKAAQLSSLIVNDDRIDQIRLGNPDPSTVRIVFEITGYRAGELNTDHRFEANNLYYVIANPDHQIIMDDIINKYILQTIPPQEEDDMTGTAPEDDYINADKEPIEDKQEESSDMKIESDIQSFQSLPFLPDSVNNFLFNEIFPGFYTLYALGIALILILLLLFLRKKPKKKPAMNHRDKYAEADSYEEETAPEESTEDLYGLETDEQQDGGGNLLFDDTQQDFTASEEDDELDVAEIVDEENGPEAEFRDTETAEEEESAPPVSGYSESMEGFDDSRGEIEQEIEKSLDIFEEAKTNVNNDQDREILIKLDEKELSEKTLEESLNESFRYYPLKVGNGWVWRYKNSLRKRMIIGKKELQGKGEVYKIKETVRIGEHKKQTIWYIYKSNKGIIEKADQYKKKILAFPIKLNKKWEDDSNNYEIIGLNDTVNNFDKCLKIQVSPKDIPIKRYIYFKKDVGLIMDEAKEELIKYKIDGVEFSI